jgi:glycosyltransferase involved in cell wall biosynthesis
VKKILLVTHVPFWRKHNGSAARIINLVSALQGANHQVGLFFVGELTQEDPNILDSISIVNRRGVIDGTSLTCKDFLTFSESIWKHFPRYLQKSYYRFTHKGFPFESYPQTQVVKCFNKFLDEYDPDCVLVEYIRFSYLFRSNDRRRLWIIDTHDVMHKRFERFSSQGLSHWVAISRDQERSALLKFDVVLAIQQEDADAFQELLGNGRTLVVPHGISAEAVASRNTEEVCIGFIGPDSPVNRDALNWFLEEIWPHCRQRFPRLRFCIAGAICKSIKMKSELGIDLLGRFNNLRDFYSIVDIIVNPIRCGGGLKIKNVEALAYGVPLITTTVGSENFPSRDESPFLVADTEGRFIEHILTLAHDLTLRHQMIKRGIEYVEQHFSMEAAYRPLLELIESNGKAKML